MYIENKSESFNGDARIGRVTFSKTMRTMYYDGKEFIKTKSGFKHNCLEIETGEEYWISGCHKDGADRLYISSKPVEIDDDVREEYWTLIRNQPQLITKTIA
jgi:outer membrane protein assembly factor BamB